MSFIPPEKFRLYKKGETNPVAEGVTKLVGTTEDGNFTAECTLTVTAAE
ncbi:hypothetical protein OHD66_002059 [Enterococcus faecalis]|nr:hypothetical protein [Enterococcus faecalis]